MDLQPLTGYAHALYLEETKRLSTALEEYHARAKECLRLVQTDEWYEDQLESAKTGIHKTEMQLSMLGHTYRTIPLMDMDPETTPYDEIIRKTKSLLREADMRMEGLREEFHRVERNTAGGKKNHRLMLEERVHYKIMEQGAFITRLHRFKLEREQEYTVALAMSYHPRLGAQSPLNLLPEVLWMEIIQSSLYKENNEIVFKKQPNVTAGTARLAFLYVVFQDAMMLLTHAYTTLRALFACCFPKRLVHVRKGKIVKIACIFE